METGTMTKKIKVLMVDDEPQFRQATQKVFRKKGFDTLIAANGREALEQLENKPDVVVLDVRMPDMDGNETLEEIRKRSPDLPVIMLTGHGADDSAKRALTQGAFDYLAKPCDIDLLASRITDASRQKDDDGEKKEERTVGDVMIPVIAYTTLTEDRTVAEGLAELKKSFVPQVHSSRIMETGHRSVLVFNKKGQLKGVLSIIDLLEAVLPGYLTAPKPSTADSLHYSPMFWTGMYTREARRLSSMKVGDLMSPVPPVIDIEANLMEAAYRLVNENCRRLVVLRDKEVAGIVREQDLFFEWVNVLP
jgi:CheY-like chemotaxis protein